MYSQGSLIRLFKEGKFPGETGVPKHIETVISNVFLFSNKVYKFYKNDNSFFNKGFRDISEKFDRFSFTKRDFEWNNLLSPEIYLDVIGVRVGDNKVEPLSCDDDNAEELVIVMERIKNEDILFEKLVQNGLSESESFSMGEQLAINLKKVQKKLDKEYNYFDVFESLINDFSEWAKSVDEYIGVEEIEKYSKYLDSFRIKNKDWFENELSSEITSIGDIHSHNAVYTDGNLYLVDTFPPKEDWFVGHRLIPLYRIAVDIWVLTDKKELFEAFIKGYEKGSGFIVNRKLDPAYIIYASGIMVSYLYMLQRTDTSKKEAAEKFHKFIREYFASISV